jgi:kynureninase
MATWAAVDALRSAGFPVMDGLYYWDGNSLGPYSPAVRTAINAELVRWEQQGIGGWTDGPDGWLHLPGMLAARLEALLGAESGTVAVTGSITSNLLNLLLTLHRPGTGLAIDTQAFMSDRIVVESIAEITGMSVTDIFYVQPTSDRLYQTEAVIAALPRGGTAVLPVVVYTTGQRLDIRAIQAAAVACDCRVIWDAAHAIGVVADLGLDVVDAVVWCHYKWMNAGPGAVAGMYVNPRHLEMLPALRGWFGVDQHRMFDPACVYVPAPGAARYQLGTPHIFSLAAVSGALQPFEAVGFAAVEAASAVVTSELRAQLVDASSAGGWKVITPADAALRGGHIALALAGAGRMSKALRGMGVVPDHRPPDILRLAPPPWAVNKGDIAAVVTKILDAARGVQGVSGDDSDQDLVP